MAAGVGVVRATEAGWTVADVAVLVVLLVFIAWRAAPAHLSPLRLRDVMALELALASLGVVVTGGWASPWLAAQFVAVGLSSLGVRPVRAALLGVVTILLDSAATLPVGAPGLELVASAATVVLVVGFAVVVRGVLLGATPGEDESLGRLEVLWSVRGLLEGLHNQSTTSGVTFQVDEAIETLRASTVLGDVDTLGLFALEPDATLRLVHGVGLPERVYRVRELPGRAGSPDADGAPWGAALPAGGIRAESAWGAYVWLPVVRGEQRHVLAVEHGPVGPTGRGPGGPTLDEVLPELARLAEPLAVTVHNAAWFSRVSHLGVGEERQRIAARLHDQFAQELAVISMHLEMAARRHPDDEQLRSLRADVGESLTGLRDTMVELRATVDEEHPLEAVLAGLLDRLRHRHGVVAELDHEVVGPPLPTTIGQQLLRMAQELTRRAVEDRGAFAIYVRYRCRPARVELSVSDDGEAPVDEPSRRIDDVVHDRAESIGAELVTDRRDGLATVTVVVERSPG